ncbi:MAG: UvrD-helicase domain-containing protein [Capsulimonadaceae bacterium]|nr:UvrD-helicase domain-containing protein [Capsulimonadaceae bacterium]
MESPLLSDLNEPQRLAVTHTDGPLLIFAGAGSGKTSVLTKRIAYLIREKYVRPYNILAVTFTNKAATEMKERIAALVGDSVAKALWAGTFHSLCARMLRERGKEIGLNPRFGIYDTDDQLTIVKESLKELNIDDKSFQPRAILNRISGFKEKLIDPSDSRVRSSHQPFDRAVASIYARYQDKLALASALDFDDLIMYAVRLLKESEPARTHYQHRFVYVHCDEFQDTNDSQYQLLKLLSGEHKNLCVVGDDDQSIYAFRGADVKIILHFEHDFPGATTIKLEQNYRSTKTILDAAYNVVKHNKSRADKRLWTDKDDGENIVLIETRSENEEGAAIAQEIRRLATSGDRRYSEIAILYRTNSQSRAIEEQLNMYRIPYKIVGGVRFWERREIKDILAYLRVITNPYDSVSLRRIINVPTRGIGATTVETVGQAAAEQRMSFWDALHDIGNLGLSPRAANALSTFVRMIEYFQSAATRKTVPELIKDILETSGYLADLKKDRSDDSRAREENLGELVTVATEFAEAIQREQSIFPDDAEPEDAGAADTTTAEEDPFADAFDDAFDYDLPELPQDATEDGATPPSGPVASELLTAFLEEVSLVSDIDTYDEEPNSVTLMTLHSAKGLEFGVVFLAGMEEGIFPHMRAFQSLTELEEERRLCYVGITRAKEQLYMSYAESRMVFGNVQRNAVSRFIAEIPATLYIPTSMRPSSQAAYAPTFDPETRRTPTQAAPRWADISGANNGAKKVVAPPVNLPYKTGDKVTHAKFGRGTVVQITPENGDAKVSVAFPAPVGIKTLMASFAKLETG